MAAMEKNFGWSVPPHVNHAFGPGHFDAYSMSQAKTLCGQTYWGLSPHETMTSTQLVTCLSCLAAGIARR